MLPTRTSLFFTIFFSGLILSAQNPYSHADSLRGGNGSARSWWDVTFYQLHVRFSEPDSSIKGSNVIHYKVLRSDSVLQLDLQMPLLLDSVVQGGKKCRWRRDGNTFFVVLPGAQEPGQQKELHVWYQGRPHVAKLPPWDGGVVWSHDKKNNTWISVACQGRGASVWYPLKDLQGDEPDSARITITAPEGLSAVSNGRLRSVTRNSDRSSDYTWAVSNPINNYNIIPYIGRYVNFKDTLAGINGQLDLDFWALEENLARARQQFAQVKPMLHCFESWFGPYPFYQDAYKLVEAPYLGMEHQSAVAYGNGYQNGYKGRDLSLTGWGMKWDFIIVHESGHEWFANSITASDVADNWIHESFTSYSENLYTEYLFGKTAGAEYVTGTRTAVLNDQPIIGSYGVNAEGSGDMYYKGANMLHTIRQIVNNDSLWRAFLLNMNKTFYHRIVTTREVEDFMTTTLKTDLQKVFDQYLRSTKIPVLEYSIKGKKLGFRWTNCVPGFNMPLKIYNGKKELMLQPKEEWTSISYRGKALTADTNYYVKTKKVN